jgi:hypothetical protein
MILNSAMGTNFTELLQEKAGVFEKEKLKKNFEAHLRELGCSAPPEDAGVLMNLEVTHTFAESNDGGKTLLLEKIFFNSNEDHRGLLSREYRCRNGLQKRNEGRQPSEIVGKFGLDNFVFAYFGSHEAYYAGTDDIDPAFGVFISKELEINDATNASRRDLASAEAREPLCEEFLMPEDARKLVACEVDKKYGGNIWNYWGTPEYAERMWERKVEMHFFEKVPTSAVKGIIWPNKIFHTEGKHNVPNKKEEERKQRFKDLYPNIKVYDYEWTPRYGQDAFLEASCYVSQYFFTHNEYPESCKIKFKMVK